MRQAAGSSLELHTFSYLADDPQLNEEKWMRIAADASGARRHAAVAAAGDLEQDLDALILCQDLPFSTTSIYAQHCVFRVVKETGIKVTLDGQGPDEMFGGYHFFRRDRARSLAARGNWRAAFRMAKLAGASPWKLLGQALAPRFLAKRLRRTFGRDPAPAWLSADWLRRSGVEAENPLPELPVREGLRHSLRGALLESGIPSLLRYEDRNSMHFSVESRVPFLTTKLAEAALSLPEEMLIAEDGTTKHLLRSAFRGLVPDEILNRRDKIGFATPEDAWLQDRAAWVRSVLDSEEARAIPAFAREALTFREGAPADFPVWRVLNFIRWSTLNRVGFF
jgi:asparagine synthase (glutamine-hydrolysing)